MMKKDFQFRIVGAILLFLLLLASSSFLFASSSKNKDGTLLRSQTVFSGQVTCASAGTKYPIPVEAEAIGITALSTNVGSIWVGSTDTATSTAGHELIASGSVTLGGNNGYIPANTIYIGCSSSGDKVSWIRLN